VEPFQNCSIILQKLPFQSFVSTKPPTRPAIFNNLFMLLLPLKSRFSPIGTKFFSSPSVGIYQERELNAPEPHENTGF